MVRRRKSGPKAELWLGATQPTGSLPIVLFVPSKIETAVTSTTIIGVVIGDKYYGITDFDSE